MYTEGLPFALKIAAGSRFNTAIKPYKGGGGGEEGGRRREEVEERGGGEEGSVGGDGRGKVFGININGVFVNESWMKCKLLQATKSFLLSIKYRMFESNCVTRTGRISDRT